MTRAEIIARSIAHDLRARVRMTTASGAQSSGPSVDEAVDYALSSARKMLERGRVDSVAGMRLLEIGPGDNLAFGLCMIAWGARSHTAIDRFVVRADPARQRAIYLRLLERFDGGPAERLSAVLAADGSIDPERVRLLSGLKVEDVARRFEPGSFDLIVSVAVCEHLRDVAASIRAMDDVLNPGGAQLHQVDLRDHGLFTSRGMGPLEWLTTSESTHKLMVRQSGGPNRVLVPDYRRILDSLGCEYTIGISQVAGERDGLPSYPPQLHFGQHYDERHRQLVAAVRPRLARRMGWWDETDLLCSGIFIKACGIPR
jgi:SAM-dependent methyltransferase